MLIVIKRLCWKHSSYAEQMWISIAVFAAVTILASVHGSKDHHVNDISAAPESFVACPGNITQCPAGNMLPQIIWLVD